MLLNGVLYKNPFISIYSTSFFFSLSDTKLCSLNISSSFEFIVNSLFLYFLKTAALKSLSSIALEILYKSSRLIIDTLLFTIFSLKFSKPLVLSIIVESLKSIDYVIITSFSSLIKV